LSCLGCFILAALCWQPCSGSSVLAVFFCLSCFSCLAYLSFSGCLLLSVLL
jgi:hypothetical protein